MSNPLLEVFRAAVDGYLGPPLWFHPSAARWITDPSVHPEVVSEAYTSSAYNAAIDLKSHIFTKSIFITTESSSYRVVSALAPDAGVGRAIMFLTETREFLYMLGTSAARYPDGTVQIYGAEPSVTLLTPARIQRQSNNQLIEGEFPRSFRFEVRDPDGHWVLHPNAATLARELLGGMVQAEPSAAETNSPTGRRMLSEGLTAILRFARRALRSDRPERPKG